MSPCPGRLQEIVFVGIKIRIVALGDGIVADVTCLRGGQRKQIVPQLGFVRGAIGPESPARFPVVAQTRGVRDSVLNDQRLHTPWTCARIITRNPPGTP